MSESKPSAAYDKVNAEPCRCVACPYCGGNGPYWVDMGAHYGQHRSDDLDEMEYCEECGGSGVVETCDRCQLLKELEDEP